MIDVVVIDDSALIRSLLSEIIGAQADMRVVGTAGDPYKGRELIKALNPAVVTLDIEMPRMNGLDFLERLMWLRPMPVVMISSMTARGTDAALRALELGAVDIVAKPALGIADGMLALETEIAEKIRIAARAKVQPLDPRRLKERAERRKTTSQPISLAPLGGRSTEKVIVVGASTGGTEAITHFLTGMPADAPAIVIAQHMPPLFTTSFARRLDSICAIAVREATAGERLLPGHAYIAPGDHHLRIARSGANYVASVAQDARVNLHRPSVDVLFASAARIAGSSAVGIILTGMGSDGAAGLRAMHDAGAMTIAQDEASCVVYGMPKAAINAGGVRDVVPLERIAETALRRIAAMGPRTIRL